MLESLAQNYPSTPPPEDRRAGSSAWNTFQKEHKGQGLSRDEMSKMYHRITEDVSSFSSAHLKKDESPDQRFKENKGSHHASPRPSPASSPHLKKDGTPDQRFRENKGSHHASPRPSPASSPHLKKDGTPDQRFRENMGCVTPSHQVTHHASSGPFKANGTPDMRNSANRELFGGGGRVLFGGSSSSVGGSVGGGGGGGGGYTRVFGSCLSNKQRRLYSKNTASSSTSTYRHPDAPERHYAREVYLVPTKALTRE